MVKKNTPDQKFKILSDCQNSYRKLKIVSSMTRTKIAGVVNISADGEVLTASNVTTPPKGRKKKNETAKFPFEFLDPDTI